jgi:pimeloyl-ACP methyl ester carboxylesterase
MSPAPARQDPGSASAADGRPTIVLVHGAWADGTSWQHVIPLLERDGYSNSAPVTPAASMPAPHTVSMARIDH